MNELALRLVRNGSFTDAMFEGAKEFSLNLNFKPELN